MLPLVLVLVFAVRAGVVHGYMSDTVEPLIRQSSFSVQKYEEIHKMFNKKDDKIRQLEIKIDKLVRAFTTYVTEKEIENQQKDALIENLKDRMTQQEKRMEDLEKECEKNMDNIPQQHHHSVVSSNVIEDRKTIEEAVRPSILHTKGTIDKRNSPLPSTIAFHASLSTNKAVYPGLALVFNTESLDVGDGYNPKDGIYITPDAGIYVITWTIYSFPRNLIQTQLFINGTNRQTALADADEVNDFHTSTGIVVTQLSKGEHVFVRVGGNTRGSIEGVYATCTFSGWKLT